MFCIKGSKHLYLIDYNCNCNLPVWSNIEDLAIKSNNLLDMLQMKEFLKEHNSVECTVERT